MKKFLLGALTGVMMFSFTAFTQASDFDTENLCCRGNYYCASDSDNGEYCYNNGDYCGRNGCGDGYRRR